MRGANKNTLLKKPEEISLYEIYTAVELEREIFNIHQNLIQTVPLGQISNRY